MPWAALDYAKIQGLRAKLGGASARAGPPGVFTPLAPATVNRHLAALRGVLREAFRLGQIGAEQYERSRTVENVRAARLPRGRALDAAELARLCDACDLSTTEGARDAALVALLYGCGLRRAEAVALDVGAYDRSTGALRVLGKRNRERLAYVTGGVKVAVDRWIRVRGTAPGPLLLPLNPRGKPDADGDESRAIAKRRRHMTDGAVRQIAKRAAKRAGLKAFSPHDLRRTFVSDLLDAGADLVTVQKLAGHSDVTTTTRYDRRPEGAKRKAASLLHVPFAAR
jgi:site-specific recombinase XerD